MKLSKTLFSLLFIAAGVAQAGPGSDGTRGGESVRIHGRPELRDLVERSNCHWVSGDEMVARTPYTQVIFANVKRIDWFFAIQLEKNMRALDYCLTGPLVRVPTEDPDGLTAVVTLNRSQLAIRLTDSVYIDMDQFGSSGATGMTNRTRGYTLAHETLHSFISAEANMRNNKIRSMAKSLEDIETGRLVTREQLHLQLQRNEIEYDRTLVDRLEPYRAQVEFAYADYSTQVRTLMSMTSKAQFFNSFKNIPSDVLENSVGSIGLLTFVDNAIAHDDVSVVQALAAEPSLSDAVERQVYLSKVAHPQLDGWMKSHGAVGRLASNVLSQLSTRSVSIMKGRAVVRGQNLLAARIDEAASSRALLDLHAVDGASELSQGMAFYVRLLQEALQQGDMARSEQLTIGNAEFYRAFALSPLASQIASTSGLGDQEKRLDQAKAEVMTVSFWQRTNMILNQSSPDQWEELKSKIDFKRLGYEF